MVFKIWGRATGRMKSYDFDVLTLGLTCERGSCRSGPYRPQSPNPGSGALPFRYVRNAARNTSCSWLAYLTYAVLLSTVVFVETYRCCVCALALALAHSWCSDAPGGDHDGRHNLATAFSQRHVQL